MLNKEIRKSLVFWDSLYYTLQDTTSISGVFTKNDVQRITITMYLRNSIVHCTNGSRG